MFLVLAVSVSAFAGCTSRKIADARAAMKYVVHGAGVLNGLNLYGEPMDFTCSNSAEGLAQCAEAGCSVIELDFNFTADRRLV